MGEAKRRKQLDPNYGKLHQIRSSRGWRSDLGLWIVQNLGVTQIQIKPRMILGTIFDHRESTINFSEFGMTYIFGDHSPKIVVGSDQMMGTIIVPNATVGELESILEICKTDTPKMLNCYIDINEKYREKGSGFWIYPFFLD
jgi:hypothetical protein